MKRRISPYILIMVTIGSIMYLTVMKLDDSVYLSELFRNILNELCGKLGIETSSIWWNTGSSIRLIGHVIEYFALGIVVGIVIKSKIAGCVVCMLMSLIDQTVKIYIPARHFDKGDIPFDMVGFSAGLAIVWVIKFAVNKVKEMGNGVTERER